MVIGLFSQAYAYPALAAIIGSATLPNYQGMFLRGFGKQSHSQNNGSTIGTTNTIHESDNLGVVQGDAIRNIEGGNIAYDGIDYGMGLNGSGAFYRGSGTGIGYEKDGIHGDHLLSFSASRVVSTADENRPVNIAVNYIIKAY